MTKALGESDPIPDPKPDLKPKPKPKPEPELGIKVNKKKLKKLRKDFDELRQKFSNKNEIREAFNDKLLMTKKDKLSESKMKKLKVY